MEVYRALLQRSVDRGQVRSDLGRDVALLTQVIPAMSGFSLGAGRDPAGSAFFVAVVDEIVLPALAPSGRGGAGDQALG